MIELPEPKCYTHISWLKAPSGCIVTEPHASFPISLYTADQLRTYGDQRAAEARADALQAMERVPMTEEVALKFAHRRATTYTHRSDPHYSGYAFVPYTLMDFVRDLEAHHGITTPESKG